MSGVRIHTVGKDEDGLRLDRWFKVHYPGLAYGRLQKILRSGEVRLDGGRVKANDRIAKGQQVRVPPLGDLKQASPAQKSKKERKAASYSDPKDRDFAKSLVVYRNADVLVIDKPAGLAVQGGTSTERHLDGMLDFLKFEKDERPRLVHRLDKDTSGVMLLARSRQSAADLTRAFKKRETRKIYWAITVRVPDPEEGDINLPLSKGGPAGRERVHADPEEGKNAITWFKVLERAGKKFALVALWPRTGRTHQLRAHMAAIGCPILGDGKYGGKDAIPGGLTHARQLHLHAREIAIPGTGMKVTAPLPEHFRRTVDEFGFDPTLYPDDPFEDRRP